MVGAPVVEHVVEVLDLVDLVPGHFKVAWLSHLHEQLSDFLCFVAVHVNGVNKFVFLE